MSRPPLDAEGPAAPPRSNGELVFEAPWEARLFGVTMIEKGVSRLVSVDLGGAEELLAAE